MPDGSRVPITEEEIYAFFADMQAPGAPEEAGMEEEWGEEGMDEDEEEPASSFELEMGPNRIIMEEYEDGSSSIQIYMSATKLLATFTASVSAAMYLA